MLTRTPTRKHDHPRRRLMVRQKHFICFKTPPRQRALREIATHVSHRVKDGVDPFATAVDAANDGTTCYEDGVLTGMANYSDNGATLIVRFANGEQVCVASWWVISSQNGLEVEDEASRGAKKERKDKFTEGKSSLKGLGAKDGGAQE